MAERDKETLSNRVKGEGQEKKDVTHMKPTTKPVKSQSPWDYYPEKGFSVFPLSKNSKVPPKGLGLSSYQKLRADEKQIAVWKYEARKGGHNIGIATGAVSGIVVFDADSEAALKELADKNEEGYTFPQVITPSGGRHFFCKYDKRLKTVRGKGRDEKIDIRADGGYVVAPPSYAEYEKGGKQIKGSWVWDEKHHLNTTPLPPVPKKWIELALKDERVARDEGMPSSPKLVQGSRDDTIFLTAVSMKHRNCTKDETLRTAIAMGKQCRPPMSARECERKVESAWTRPPIPMSIKMEDVVEEEMLWLWKNYIPSEAITLVSGDPDAGKSWWAMDLACKVSRGSRWADGTVNGNAKNVYYMTYEDSLSKHIKKRLRTLNGDMNRIICYNSKHPLHLTLAEPQGIERLENELRRLGIVDGGLLIIDPILDFTGDCNPNAVEVVRGLLTPIVAMLERLHIACLMVGHLNKDQMKSAMYRAGGSTGGWMGKARSAFLIARDPEERQKRYVVPIKHNYAWPEPVQMYFEIIEGRLLFETSDVDINEVLNPKRGRRPERREEAIEWLNTQFENREEINSADLKTAAERDGISYRTLKRVKADAGYQSVRIFGEEAEVGVDRWMWKKR